MPPVVLFAPFVVQRAAVGNLYGLDDNVFRAPLISTAKLAMFFSGDTLRGASAGSTLRASPSFQEGVRWLCSDRMPLSRGSR